MSKRIFTIALIVFVFILSACNFPLLKDKQDDLDSEDVLLTAVAGTVQAMNLTQPTAEFTLQPDVPTATLPPTTGVQPTMPSNTLPTSTPQACNQAYFVTETIPDDTKFNPGEGFTKTWTFQNIGTCTWNTNYKLVFVSGDAMDGPQSVNLPNNVAPDQQVTVSVDLKTPATEGTYTGYWTLKADDESIFFSNVSVKIVASASAFQVTGVTTDLSDHEPDDCSPYNLYYSIFITTSSAGKVTYYITNSEGETSSTESLTFDSAGTKEVDDLHWDIHETGSYWIKVYIDKPNHQEFGKFYFDIDCP